MKRVLKLRLTCVIATAASSSAVALAVSMLLAAGSSSEAACFFFGGPAPSMALRLPANKPALSFPGAVW